MVGFGVVWFDSDGPVSFPVVVQKKVRSVSTCSFLQQEYEGCRGGVGEDSDAIGRMYVYVDGPPLGCYYFVA